MEYLPWSNRVQQGDPVPDDEGLPPLHRQGQEGHHHRRWRHRGADCLGTVHQQGAESVHQFEIMPRPPETRADSTRGRSTR